MDFFESGSYKKIIRDTVDQYKQQFGQRVTYQKLAAACGIQKAYLSRVLNGDTNLSADQCYMACDFLQLGATKTEFTLLLHTIETSHYAKRREDASQRAQKIRDEFCKTENFLAEDTDFSESVGIEYFGNANLQLVYLCLTIPALRKNPAAIGDFLGLSKEEFQQVLMRLQNLHLVTFDNGQYQVEAFKRHLSADSPYIWNYHLTHRLKICNRLQSSPNSKDYFFSSLFSADQKTRQELHRMILELVSEMQKKVSAAEETSVYQLNIDLASWA